jgi:prevent-host-death family protein
MYRVPASQAREKLADIVNEVAFGHERIVLHRHGKDLVAVIPVEDLQLLEELEDRADLAAAKKALAEKGSPVPWKVLREQLGKKQKASR